MCNKNSRIGYRNVGTPLLVRIKAAATYDNSWAAEDESGRDIGRNLVKRKSSKVYYVCTIVEPDFSLLANMYRALNNDDDDDNNNNNNNHHKKYKADIEEIPFFS
ncbi:hypothetical protein V9T40_003079 [Parthenolecanium corni]|uniref:Uncharacterized protein n=1 Tax=Parthenolecanium corni TaxID=536013 RepID=A0AAN9YA40_9HEMI